jgi:hypothetical protein
MRLVHWLSLACFYALCTQAFSSQSTDTADTECLQDQLYYTFGWKWKPTRLQADFNTHPSSSTEKDAAKHPDQRQGSSRSSLTVRWASTKFDSSDRLGEQFGYQVKRFDTLGEHKVRNYDTIKLTLFRFRPFRSLFSLRRWAGIRIQLSRSLNHHRSGKASGSSEHSRSPTGSYRMIYELRDQSAKSFRYLQRWGLLKELEAAEQRMSLVWKMGKRRALRFKGLPRCSNMGIWYAYTLFISPSSISDIVVRPVSWFLRFPVEKREFKMTLVQPSASKSSGKKDASQRQAGQVFSSLFVSGGNHNGLVPVTFNRLDLWSGRKIIEFLEDQKINIFLTGYAV